MSYASEILGYNESSSMDYDSDFLNEEGSCFGRIKTRRPSKEGFGSAVDALDFFNNATDGKLDSDSRVSLHRSYPKSGSSLKFKDVDSKRGSRCVDCDDVDDWTMESIFSSDHKPFQGGCCQGQGSISFKDLASDDDVVVESVTGWNDLY